MNMLGSIGQTTVIRPQPITRQIINYIVRLAGEKAKLGVAAHAASQLRLFAPPTRAPFCFSFQVMRASRICPAPHPRHDGPGQYDLRK